MDLPPEIKAEPPVAILAPPQPALMQNQKNVNSHEIYRDEKQYLISKKETQQREMQVILKQQIEEKQRQKEAEKEKRRLEDERDDRRFREELAQNSRTP